jgi:glycine cleavage system H protein
MGERVPEGLWYSREHEWVRPEDGAAVIGITSHAADQLGDIVYVDLPTLGTRLDAGRPFGEIESTKSVSELFAPIGGTVAERNDELDRAPELVNRDPYGAAWMVRVVLDGPLDTAGLLDPSAYRALIGP